MTQRFGELLKAERKRQRLSQPQLAAIAGIDASHISRLESGNRAPSREMTIRLTAALNLSIDSDTAQTLLRAAGFATYGEEAIHPGYAVVTRLNDTLNNPLLTDTDRELVIDAVNGILGLSFVRTPQATVIRLGPRDRCPQCGDTVIDDSQAPDHPWFCIPCGMHWDATALVARVPMNGRR